MKQELPPGEVMVLLVAGSVGLGAVISGVGALWLKGAKWMVQQGLLVSAKADPLLVIPGAGGAGLDILRLLVVAGVLLIVVASLVSGARRAWLARSAEEA